MRSNIVIPTEATHSSLDLFEKPPLLVTFDQSFEQRTGPKFSPAGSSLDFEIVGDRNNFIDLQKIFLEVKCKVINANGTDLAVADEPVLANNVLHSLFEDCIVSANGIKISSANGYYAHKAFIETEFSHGADAKKTWLHCQGYEYEPLPGTIVGARLQARKDAIKESREYSVFGRLAVDFFSCDKHLLSGVTLRINLRRSRDAFAVISESNVKDYKVNIIEANLYVRKMTVSENVVTAIEKTLLKTPAMYRYNEVVPKSFLMSAGVMSWKQEDIFTKEPIRRLLITICDTDSFAGTNNLNPFHYEKSGLREITVYRNGFAIVGTPLSTVDDKRLYFNSMGALAYMDDGHGITLGEYPNHYVMVFDLTSTQEATHDFIHPELTNCSVTVELKLGTPLPGNSVIFCLGEKASTIYIDSSRNVSLNSVPIT